MDEPAAEKAGRGSETNGREVGTDIRCIARLFSAGLSEIIDF
jgi:hypothetical protein